MSRAEDLEKLKAELGKQLICDPAQLKRPEGIPTGHKELDQFLLWNGFPKGALSRLSGKPGLGATSLWLGAAIHVTKQRRWVAWVDQSRRRADNQSRRRADNQSRRRADDQSCKRAADEEVQLFPLHMWQKDLDLSRLVTIEAPETEKKLLWLLQELMASTLFDLIGCDLGQVRLRDSQVRQLQKQARTFNTALVFVAHEETKSGLKYEETKSGIYRQSQKLWAPSLYSLIVNFTASAIEVERALHKPTPFSIARRVTYDSFAINVTVNECDRSVPHFTHGLSAAALQGLQPNLVLNSPEKSKRREWR